MEIQLQELMEQIKKEGVEAAEREAADILEKANKDAEKIISDAQKRADSIVLQAKTEADRVTKSGEDTLRQAGRNLLISFRESVNKELEHLLSDSVNSIYSSDDLKSVIVKAIENWTNNKDADDITLILTNEELSLLQASLLSVMKERLSKGVVLKSSDELGKGFRIAESNGSVYYDYSSEAVVNMLSSYLGPKITALLKEADNS